MARKNTAKTKKSKQIFIFIGSVVVLILGVFVGTLGWQGSTREIETTANQFKSKDSWRLETNHVRPPKIVCLDGGSCPELSRTWLVDKKISKEDFQNILNKSGWNFNIEGDCTRPSNIHGKFVSTCWANGGADGFNVSIGLSENSNSSQEQRISLSVRPQ